MLDKLKGGNSAAAPQVPIVLKQLKDEENSLNRVAFAKEHAALVSLQIVHRTMADCRFFFQSPWEELDLEEAMLLEDPYAGLGFGQKDPDWYGGKVVFRATLKDTKEPGVHNGYDLVLERAELGASCRFTQRFGSKRFIRVSIQNSILTKRNNCIIEYFNHPFVLNGRVFRAYFAKDHNVFLVETNEVTDGLKVSESPLPPCEQGPLPFLHFLRWHNPLEINAKQVSLEVT